MSLAIAAAKPQGDPGLFGFLGKAVGTVTGLAASFIPGPAGAIARTLQSRIFGGGTTARPLPQAMPPLPSIQQYTPPPSFKPELRARTMGTGSMPQLPPGVSEERLITDITPAIACPKGYRPNKSAYYRRLKTPGNPDGQLIYVTPKSRCVRIRKRNAANPRAADRAIGRIKSAKRFAKKMGSITIRETCG